MNNLQDILNTELFTVAGTTVDVSTLGAAITVAIVGFFLARIAENAMNRFFQARDLENEGSASTGARLVHHTIVALGLGVALHTLGLNLTALFAAGAFFAIAIGFAIQNITQNFVAGIILLVERTIKPGDIIEIEGRMVKITKLGIRATVVRTWDSDDFIIPNSTLVTNTVKNYTLRDKLHRIRVLVGVSYESDMKKVRETLLAIANGVEWRDDSIAPVVLMKNFGSSSVDFDVSVWIDNPFGRSSCQSLLNEAIWFGLKEAGITIAYPQLDVHLDRPVVEAMQSRQAES